MSRIVCPKCRCEEFDIYDNEYSMDQDLHFAYCCCDECGAQFSIKYEVTEIAED